MITSIQVRHLYSRKILRSQKSELFCIRNCYIFILSIKNVFEVGFVCVRVLILCLRVFFNHDSNICLLAKFHIFFDLLKSVSSSKSKKISKRWLFKAVPNKKNRLISKLFVNGNSYKIHYGSSRLGGQRHTRKVESYIKSNTNGVV